MDDFEKAAREWCRVRLLYLAAKKKAAEYECTGPRNLCWWSAIYEDALPFEEWCEQCQERQQYYQERTDLGLHLPQLAKEMYAAYRKETGHE